MTDPYDDDLETVEEPTQEQDNDEAQDDSHFVAEPTEEDYEKARTVGIGNEPELPAGKVENGARVRARFTEGS